MNAPLGCMHIFEESVQVSPGSCVYHGRDFAALIVHTFLQWWLCLLAYNADAI